MTNSSETSTTNGAAEAAKESPFEAAQGAAEAEPAPSAEALLKAEVASLKDRILRTMAEMENLRRRTEKEVADAKTYGVSSFAREMLVVADNLQRAQASLTAETRRELGAVARSFVEGVELTERDFLSRLARIGVKPIETTGQRFDPNRHEALFELPDDSVPAGTIVQQVETGYAIGDRVLRPAKVGVSRGGPRPESASGAD